MISKNKQEQQIAFFVLIRYTLVKFEYVVKLKHNLLDLSFVVQAKFKQICNLNLIQRYKKQIILLSEYYSLIIFIEYFFLKLIQYLFLQTHEPNNNMQIQ